MELDTEELEATKNREKTADELFEELGYKKTEDYYEGNIYEIKYFRDDKYSTNITIRLGTEMFKIDYGEKGSAGWCDINILQAINKKVEELRMEVEKCEYCKKKINNKKIRDIDNDKDTHIEIVNQKLSFGPMLYVEIEGEDLDGYKPSQFF